MPLISQWAGQRRRLHPHKAEIGCGTVGTGLSAEDAHAGNRVRRQSGATLGRCRWRRRLGDFLLRCARRHRDEHRGRGGRQQYGGKTAATADLGFLHDSTPLLAEVAVEEFHNHVVAIARFRNVGVVEEPVEHSFPDVQVGIDTSLDQA
jgi:hypothetical protein